MKRFALLVLPIAVLACVVGCDDSALPADLKALVAAQPIGGDLLQPHTQTRTQNQLRLHLQDGACDGSGNQYGGANGGGGSGGGDRDRLRDGSCGN